MLLDEGERIRRELIVLGGHAQRLRGGGDEQAAAIAAALVEVAAVLQEIAAALTEGRQTRGAVLSPARAQVESCLAVLEDAAAGTPSLGRRAAAVRLRALSGQLRAAVDTAVAGATKVGSPSGRTTGDRGCAIRSPPCAPTSRPRRPPSATPRGWGCSSPVPIWWFAWRGPAAATGYP